MAITLTQITPVKLLILIIFHNIMAYYKRTFCWPTRATIVRLIHQRIGREYSLSWIDECLHWLNQNGYLVSYFRPGKNDDGTRFNRPSNRQLPYKSLKLMKKIGIKPARFLWNVSKRLFPPKDPTPITQQKPPDPKEKFLQKPGKNPFKDPEFRKKRGLKPLPPFKSKTN